MPLLVYKDGTVEEVVRCFAVHDRKRDKKGKLRDRVRFVAQTRIGGALKWLKPRELDRVELPEFPQSYVPPSPWGQAG